MPQLGSPPVVYTPVIYYSPINQIPNAASTAVFAPTIASTAYGKQDLEQNHQFNLTIQRDIGFNTVVDVAYVGNFNRHAFQDLQINNIPEHAYADPNNLFNNTALNANLLRTGYPGLAVCRRSCCALCPVRSQELESACAAFRWQQRSTPPSHLRLG